MGPLGKIIAVALAAAIFCSVLKDQNKAISMVLSVAGCILIVLVGLPFLNPVIDVIKKLRDLSGVDDSLYVPVIKVVGISLAAGLAESVCQDSGEAALSRAVHQMAVLLAVYASLPLITAVLELMESLIGGGM